MFLKILFVNTEVRVSPPNGEWTATGKIIGGPANGMAGEEFWHVLHQPEDDAEWDNWYPASWIETVAG